jgi:hypothetical protein
MEVIFLAKVPGKEGGLRSKGGCRLGRDGKRVKVRLFPVMRALPGSGGEGKTRWLGKDGKCCHWYYLRDGVWLRTTFWK